MIEAFAVIQETNKYQYRRLLQLVKGKITITNEREQTTSFLLLMLFFFFVRIAIEKALKRPKMRSFEGARRRREKFWCILRGWEKKIITPPLLIAVLKQAGSYNKLY